MGVIFTLTLIIWLWIFRFSLKLTMPRERISTRSNIPVASNPKLPSKKSQTENLNSKEGTKLKINSKSRSSKNRIQVTDGGDVVRRPLSVVDCNATYTVKSAGSNSSYEDKNDVFYNDIKSMDNKKSVRNAKVNATASTRSSRNCSQSEHQSLPFPCKLEDAATTSKTGESSSPPESKFNSQIPSIALDDHDFLPEDVINIEVDDGLFEYSREVVLYLMHLETTDPIPPSFLKEGSITANMRSILVDWLIQVQHHLKLSQETLYLAVGILDMVLHRRDVHADKLQLVGITALLVASKLEEYYPADIKKLLHMTENSYSRLQVTHMERTMLQVLEFQLYLPSPQVFLLRFTRAALRSEDSEFVKTCQFIMDTYLPHALHPCTPPSCLAAAAVASAILVYHVSSNPTYAIPSTFIWTPTLIHYTTYSFSSIHNTCILMLDQLRATTCSNAKLTGSLNKYKSFSQHQRLALARHLSVDVLQRSFTVLTSWK